jgi:hypothetical protein
MRFRRALVLLGMTLVVPGSAQLVCGNRTVGRVVVRIWATLVVLALTAALAIWLDSTFAVQLATDPSALLVLRVGLMIGAVGWVLLLLDAWRLGEPPSMPRRSRLALAGVSAALVAALTTPLLMSAQVVAVQRDVLLEVFGDGTAVDAADGRYNVLLLGGDSGAERWGVRPDSVTLASVDAETGRTVLLSLPATWRTSRSRPTARWARRSRTASTAKAATSTASTPTRARTARCSPAWRILAWRRRFRRWRRSPACRCTTTPW